MNDNVLQLNSDFLRRMQGLLDKNDFNAYLSALNEPPKKIARINPLKPVNPEIIRAELGGFPEIPPLGKPGLCALHAAGAYYVQEPAAAAVSKLIIPHLPKGGNVLDMCAAPGGKVTAAATARPDCNFVANEVVFSRAKILLSNVERMGLRNCTVTSLRPDDIAKSCNGLFDAIIADVPCSGEGMIRKTLFNTGDLSEQSVAACAARAQKILDECDKCLKAGGIMLFSTCTFNRDENEEQVTRFISEYGYVPVMPAEFPEFARHGFDLPEAMRFFPQDGGGEGHFAVLLRKPDSFNAQTQVSIKKRKNGISDGDKRKNSAANKKILGALNAASKITTEVFIANNIIMSGEGCELLADNYPFLGLPALRRGMRIADFIGERAVFHHHFATAANAELLLDSPEYNFDSAEISAYLRGTEFACDCADGYRILKVCGITLGFIKASGGTAKNHYPKGLRI